MRATTLVAAPNFGFGANHVRRGGNGKLIGMIWLDGPDATEPLRDVTISDMGFDPRAGTETYYPVSGRHVSLHNCEHAPAPARHVQESLF